MKAAITLAPHEVVVDDVGVVRAGAGEALIRVERVGICGGDIHLYHGRHPYAIYPRIQGHELSGRVLELAPDYEGPVSVGDRVAVEPLIPCGACYPCRIGRSNCCTRLKVLGAHVDGAFRELISLPTSMLYQSGDLDADQAALVEPISIAVQVVARGAVAAGEQVVVMGAGPIGVGVCLAAVDRGARVMAVDKLPSRLAIARAFGAEQTVLADEEDVLEAVTRWTNGDGAPVVVDAVGAPAVIRQCIDLVASAGRVVIVGLSDKAVSLPIIDFTRKELTILGSRNNAGLFGDAVALVQRHRDRVAGMVTHHYPLDRFPEAIAFAADHPERAEKVMIDVWN